MLEIATVQPTPPATTIQAQLEENAGRTSLPLFSEDLAVEEEEQVTELSNISQDLLGNDEEEQKVDSWSPQPWETMELHSQEFGTNADDNDAEAAVGEDFWDVQPTQEQVGELEDLQPQQQQHHQQQEEEGEDLSLIRCSQYDPVEQFNAVFGESSFDRLLNSSFRSSTSYHDTTRPHSPSAINDDTPYSVIRLEQGITITCQTEEGFRNLQSILGKCLLNMSVLQHDPTEQEAVTEDKEEPSEQQQDPFEAFERANTMTQQVRDGVTSEGIYVSSQREYQNFLMRQQLEEERRNLEQKISELQSDIEDIMLERNIAKEALEIKEKSDPLLKYGHFSKMPQWIRSMRMLDCLEDLKEFTPERLKQRFNNLSLGMSQNCQAFKDLSAAHIGLTKCREHHTRDSVFAQILETAGGLAELHDLVSKKDKDLKAKESTLKKLEEKQKQMYNNRNDNTAV